MICNQELEHLVRKDNTRELGPFDTLVCKLIADGFSNYDISRIHVVQTYCEHQRRRASKYATPEQAETINVMTSIYRMYTHGFYTMMRGLNAGAGVMPSRSIPEWTKKRS